jgi:hypothetical protein
LCYWVGYYVPLFSLFIYFCMMYGVVYAGWVDFKRSLGDAHPMEQAADSDDGEGEDEGFVPPPRVQRVTARSISQEAAAASSSSTSQRATRSRSSSRDIAPTTRSTRSSSRQ